MSNTQAFRRVARFGACSRRCDMIRLRSSCSAALALAFLSLAIHHTAARAQPDPKPPDRKAPGVDAELVGQASDGTPSGPLGVSVAGEYAYLAAWRRGLLIFQVSDPKAPTQVSSCPILGQAKGVAVDGRHAYVAAQEGGLRLLDVSDPRNPKPVGFYHTRGFADAVA